MSSIRLVTEVPGPQSRALAKRATGSIARPVVPGGEIYIARGDGAVLEDVDGNRFIDLIGGVGCLIVGHAHPKVVAAVDEQMRRSLHTDFSLIPYESYIILAERLSDLCGGGRKAAFFNSGAEAVENAVKIARGATGRPGIVCFEGAFHGRTLMALTMTFREVPHKRGFGPFAPEVYRVPYPGFAGCGLADSLTALQQTLRDSPIAGVVVEPVLGEGGFIVPPGDFLKEIAALCSDAGAVFIADEIQSGYGRTGTFLASEQFGVRPDLVLLGKSIGAGLPLSAVVGDPRWMDALEPNAIGGTYVGNPVACAAGLAVLDVIEEQNLLQRARDIGRLLVSGWTGSPGVKEVRGLGAMVGVEFDDPDVTKQVIDRARSGGVLAMTAGPRGEAIRHLMPLVITDDEVEEAFEVFRDCLA